MSSDTNFQHRHDNKYYASIISLRKYKQLSIATELQTTTVTTEKHLPFDRADRLPFRPAGSETKFSNFSCKFTYVFTYIVLY